jgi:hypothetical protein
MYRERLVLTLQRMLRSGMFSTKGLGSAVPSSSMRGDSGKHEVSSSPPLLIEIDAVNSSLCLRSSLPWRRCWDPPAPACS